MNRNAMSHLYGQSVREDFSWLPRDERGALEASEPAPSTAFGSIYVVTVDSGHHPHRWRFVDSFRAPTPKAAYRLARERNPEHRGQGMRVEGPGGSGRYFGLMEADEALDQTMEVVGGEVAHV